MGDNVLIPKSSITRPRDLRSSKKKKTTFSTPFSRASAARCSLGATSHAWFDAAERAEFNTETKSSTTWSQQSGMFTIAKDDLPLEYDKSLLKRARLVTFKGPLEVEQAGCRLQPVLDKVIGRFWGLRIANVDQSPWSEFPFHHNDVIVRVNDEDFFGESRDNLSSALIEAFSKPQITVISLLKEEDFPYPFPTISRPSPQLIGKESPNSCQTPNQSRISPVSNIKNLNAFNTRAIGQMISVDLIKLADGGFGISFATRDALVNTNEIQPVFIERIMPTGSAIQDGRLQFGDRLLSINGLKVTTFKEAMKALRSIGVGEEARLIFSRQNSMVGPAHASPCSSSSASPVDFLNDGLLLKASSPSLESELGPPVRRRMVFEIPVPHPDSGISGLGIRFEMWTKPHVIHPPVHSKSNEPKEELFDDKGDYPGLFVKQVLTDSPADTTSASGTVRPGDRLVEVNNRCVIGLSLNEIKSILKEAVEKAQVRTVQKNKQVFLQLTVDRFYHRSEKSGAIRDSCSGSKPILHQAEDSSRDHQHSQNTTPGRETLSKKMDVGHPPHRVPRTPSVDSRGRSRREKESRSSSVSPVRCQSAFTRDAIGRRSVSEKRHAHMSATNFIYYNENVLPLRNKGDDQGARLYSTMPASRKIRQLRRSRQGRASGPVKPIHREDLEKPPETMEAETPDVASPSPLRNQRDDDVLRTDAADEHGPLEPPAPTLVSRARSQNHSFRAAVNPRPRLRSPPPNPTQDADHSEFEVAHQPESPPIPTRRSKILSSAKDLSTSSSSDKPPQQPLSSFHSTSEAAHRKPSQDCMQYHRNNKKEAFSHSSSFRKSSVGLLSNKDVIYNAPTTNPNSDFSYSVSLTGARPVPFDPQRTPSPVEFNAYAAEQERDPYYPPSLPQQKPSCNKPASKFLEEVETCLPKRRIGRSNETPQMEELSCTNSDPALTPSYASRITHPFPLAMRDGYATTPMITTRKTNFSVGRHSQKAIPMEKRDLESKIANDRFMMPQTKLHPHQGRTKLQMKSASPHAIVRSRSPPLVYSNDVGCGHGKHSNSTFTSQSNFSSSSAHHLPENPTTTQSRSRVKSNIIHRMDFILTFYLQSSGAGFSRIPARPHLSATNKHHPHNGVHDDRLNRSSSLSRHIPQSEDPGRPRSYKSPERAVR
ncbi:unnamed protein product [Mesocestoides corti]|uniref:PDZ domain-containing protein n=1 Tax=Mesocestoides corti TaxID=53468 RepID=A0A3P6I3K9_MESCO|nr:unnamed protein product [Mesocestoides corti]